MKILFLIKENYGYGNCGYGSSQPKSGLLESARLTVSQLVDKLKVIAKIAICIDGNSVDKEVYQFKPDICVIEALWVTPLKIKELIKLHPKVKFVIRIHSEIPFLAMEGIAIEWIKEYSKIKGISIAFNSLITHKDFLNNGIDCIFLPNIYSDVIYSKLHCNHKHKTTINIGCFGSIRPLKNQLLQAFAAIQFGNKNKLNVNFHINGTRIEQRGEPVLKNIRNLFKNSRHNLIEHEWLPREEFLSLVRRMDLGLQISFSESFNIVTADFVYSNVPIIVSETIEWMPSSLKVKNDVSDVANKISTVLNQPNYYKKIAARRLNSYNFISLKLWKNYLK